MVSKEITNQSEVLEMESVIAVLSFPSSRWGVRLLVRISTGSIPLLHWRRVRKDTSGVVFGSRAGDLLANLSKRLSLGREGGIQKQTQNCSIVVYFKWEEMVNAEGFTEFLSSCTKALLEAIAQTLLCLAQLVGK